MIPQELEINFKDQKYPNTTARMLVVDGILILTAKGQHDIQLAKDSFATTLGIFFKEGVYKTIVDISDLRGEVSSIQKYDYMEYVGKMLRAYFNAGGRPPKIAYVLEEQYLESNKGFTDVLRKEYSLIIHSFTTQEEAKKWLNS